MHSTEYNSDYDRENWIDWQLHFTVLSLSNEFFIVCDSLICIALLGAMANALVKESGASEAIFLYSIF